MWELILLSIVLITGLGIGYWLGGLFTRKENTALQKQVTLLKEYSTHWAKEATAKSQLQQQVSAQQTQNTATAIQTFILLLQSFQQRQANAINQEEQEKLDRLINQVKNNFS